MLFGFCSLLFCFISIYFTITRAENIVRCVDVRYIEVSLQYSSNNQLEFSRVSYRELSLGGLVHIFFAILS